MNFRIEPIPAEITSEVRRSMVSPQYRSLMANASVANGYGPCRSCLRVFDQGVDRRIYFTYNSFDGLADLPDPGPVFIHENECKAFEGDFPEDILMLPVYLEAFGNESVIVQRVRMDSSTVNAQLSELLNRPDVQFVNLRNAEVGCFIARVVRT
jgi:Protein of unknown function (DUF1203)